MEHMERANAYQNRIKVLRVPSGITGSQSDQNVRRVKTCQQCRSNNSVSNSGKERMGQKLLEMNLMI